LVKQVTSVLYYAKEVAVNGRQELVEVSIRDMRIKEVVKQEWGHCMEVDLKFVDMDNEAKRLSGKEMYQRVEVLKECWLQLADGLVEEAVA
jgi:hypothetical protein